ncbi:unnamed protein product [Rangifer tarandus platyrhynchus]|uniref:Uncharacterized protein n=1 Tax=Rangifer tarandus platyrhynchus TaxID=3082113 RepID=A0AC59Z350_RANTA
MPGRGGERPGRGEPAGGPPRAQRRPSTDLPGLSRKGPSLPTSRPRDRETRRCRRRRPAPRDPAGPAPSTAAHSALPGASPGSPASYFHRTGLLSTHFIIPFQAGDFAAELKLLISVTSFFLSCDLDE